MNLPYPTIDEYRIKNKILTILFDEYPPDPRDWDNIGNMICFTRDYDLGDNHDFADREELEDFIQQNHVVALPLYLYDHNRLSISTKPFDCNWGSVKIGYIYTTKEKIKQEKLTEKQAIDTMKAEVDTYDSYINGEVFAFTLEEEKTCKTCENTSRKMIDSCDGFYTIKDMLADIPKGFHKLLAKDFIIK